MSSLSNRLNRRFGLFAALLLAGLAMNLTPAIAGTFSDFRGSWSGSGTIRPRGGEAERIRCHANYKPRGSADRELEAHLRCASASYNFDLTGKFVADEHGRLSGEWSENTRNIGGNVIGETRADHLRVRVEAPGFSADLDMVMRGRRQSVTIDSFGGGEIVRATISLSRS